MPLPTWNTTTGHYWMMRIRKDLEVGSRNETGTISSWTPCNAPLHMWIHCKDYVSPTVSYVYLWPGEQTNKMSNITLTEL